MTILTNRSFFNTFLSFAVTLLLTSCSGISPGDILKIPKQEDRKTPSEIPEEKERIGNTAVFDYPSEKVWDATIESLYWIKWKPFMKDTENNVLVLKEAYVYENQGSIKRIYNWPPVSELRDSDLGDYLEKISVTENNNIRRKTVFTQENMRIKITEESPDRTVVSLRYEVIPHMSNGDIGNILESSKYIESALLSKIEENLEK